ncbi:MAG: DNA mismatch repair protein MutS [Verrucomicrobia bacterium]|nr:DNA mismatch repair protein MutS [Verrucomicrobiota bacterium]
MPNEKTKKMTPMMQQWHSIRSQLPEDTLLFFRLGDFYEIFHQDAEKGAKLLGITLTQRNDIPMAGIPYHAADNYLQKLLNQGIKIAFCEQMEPAIAGKIVERKLTRIITPGTRLAENQIEANRNQFLLAIEFTKTQTHLAWLDLTTGTFAIATDSHHENLTPLIESLGPKEILIPEKSSTTWTQPENPWSDSFQYLKQNYTLTTIPDYHFDPIAGARTTCDTLDVLNLNGFGITEQHPALGAAGAILQYASETLCNTPANIKKIEEYKASENLLIDPATQQNLEIFKSATNTSGNSKHGSLLHAMDGTVTPPGSRLLERWMAQPLLDLDTLNNRQNCVHEFVQAPGLATDLQNTLKQIRDLERILGRLQNRIQNPRELGGIRDSLEKLPQIKAHLAEFPDSPVEPIAEQIDTFDSLSTLLAQGLADELPSKLDEGGTIRNGFDSQLDELRTLSSSSKTWLAEFEQKEQARTGIKNLRIRYNGAYGYFIEITKSHLKRVPEDYTRRQTMKNAERFVTPELKEQEQAILQAEEQSIAREHALFQELIQSILTHSDALKSTAEAIAQLDVLIGFANKAREWDYCKPTLDHSNHLHIEQGRHPVVEQMLKESPLGLAGTHAFVPNDCHLSTTGDPHPQIALLTGPNMAGKSTYIRQVALIVLMAQTGAWVPATQCHIGIVDRIFSRVGASDQLAQGNSTFMVEMNETANILNNHTENSLIILDEIGRGTSTYDGLSIAWAVIEHLHTDNQAGPRTLFATHYHELTKLSQNLQKLENFSIAVKEWNDEIIFVRQIIKGPADRSYGIQVARLAGLPPSVIDRAKTILDQLENNSQQSVPTARTPKDTDKKNTDSSSQSPQFDLFS